MKRGSMSDQLSWISCLQEMGRNADGMVDLSSVIRARRQELYVQILKETGSTMVKKNLVLNVQIHWPRHVCYASNVECFRFGTAKNFFILKLSSILINELSFNTGARSLPMENRRSGNGVLRCLFCYKKYCLFLKISCPILMK